MLSGKAIAWRRLTNHISFRSLDIRQCNEINFKSVCQALGQIWSFWRSPPDQTACQTTMISYVRNRNWINLSKKSKCGNVLKVLQKYHRICRTVNIQQQSSRKFYFRIGNGSFCINLNEFYESIRTSTRIWISWPYSDFFHLEAYLWQY